MDKASALNKFVKDTDYISAVYHGVYFLKLHLSTSFRGEMVS
jgi:uncharacterized protein YdaU (DUF1376 family)